MTRKGRCLVRWTSLDGPVAGAGTLASVVEGLEAAARRCRFREAQAGQVFVGLGAPLPVDCGPLDKGGDVGRRALVGFVKSPGMARFQTP